MYNYVNCNNYSNIKTIIAILFLQAECRVAIVIIMMLLAFIEHSVQRFIAILVHLASLSNETFIGTVS